MLDRFLDFIREYQMRVREAALLFREYKRLDEPSLWQQSDIPQHGFLDSERSIPYAFQSVGCRVGLPSGEISWQFGHDDRVDGFNLWFLWCFAKDGTNNFPEFKDQQRLYDALNHALNEGVIHRPFRAFHDDLFYLRLTDPPRRSQSLEECA